METAITRLLRKIETVSGALRNRNSIYSIWRARNGGLFRLPILYGNLNPDQEVVILDVGAGDGWSAHVEFERIQGLPSRMLELGSMRDALRNIGSGETRDIAKLDLKPRRVFRALARVVGLDVQPFLPYMDQFLQIRHAIDQRGVDLICDIGANTGQFSAKMKRNG